MVGGLDCGRFGVRADIVVGGTVTVCGDANVLGTENAASWSDGPIYASKRLAFFSRKPASLRTELRVSSPKSGLRAQLVLFTR